VPFQFRLVHLLYATAVLAAGMATFGGVGIVWALVVVLFWAAVSSSIERRVWITRALLFVLVVAFFVACLLPAISTSRRVSHLAHCKNNLKMIALALHSYHEAFGAFPPAYIADSHGKRMHSWRALILPFLGDNTGQYKFNEPWNGPNNSKLLVRTPDVFGCPSQIDRATNPAAVTNYVAVVGEDTAWPGAEGRTFAEFGGNAANTILVLEVIGQAIPWLEPRDVTVDEAVEMLTETDPEKAGVHRREGFFYDEVYMDRNVAMADGSVPDFGTSVSPDQIRSLLTTDGSAKVEDLRFEWARSAVRPRLGNWFRLAVFLALALFPLPWVWRKRTESASGKVNAESPLQAS
jgi:hypothetical protein